MVVSLLFSTRMTSGFLKNLHAKLQLSCLTPIPIACFASPRPWWRWGEGTCACGLNGESAPGEPWSEFIYVNGGFAQTNSFFLSRKMALQIPFRNRVRQHEDSLFFFDAEALGARYRLIDEPLSIWNYDDRKDRLGRTPDLKLSLEFISEAGPLLTERARMAFEVRYLGPFLVRDNPAAALRLFARALLRRAVKPRHLVGVAARCILPQRGVEALRRLIARILLRTN